MDDMQGGTFTITNAGVSGIAAVASAVAADSGVDFNSLESEANRMGDPSSSEASVSSAPPLKNFSVSALFAESAVAGSGVNG